MTIIFSIIFIFFDIKITVCCSEMPPAFEHHSIRWRSKQKLKRKKRAVTMMELQTRASSSDFGMELSLQSLGF